MCKSMSVGFGVGFPMVDTDDDTSISQLLAPGTLIVHRLSAPGFKYRPGA